MPRWTAKEIVQTYIEPWTMLSGWWDFSDPDYVTLVRSAWCFDIHFEWEDAQDRLWIRCDGFLASFDVPPGTSYVPIRAYIDALA